MSNTQMSDGRRTNPTNWKSDLNRNAHRVVLSGQPIAMHCHHYNINLQKTLEDALGQAGIDLLRRSAEEAIYRDFKAYLSKYPMIRSVKSRLEMAEILYQNCGMGIIHFEKSGPDRWRIVSPSSHHVTGWLAKHGRRNTPGCHFSRGWIAGVLAVIAQQRPEYYRVEELNCKMMRDETCIFQVAPRYLPVADLHRRNGSPKSSFMSE